jgi:hypothetical protein
MVTDRTWVAEEIGLTHLDELGGTAVLEFLDTPADLPAGPAAGPPADGPAGPPADGKAAPA